MLRLLLDLAPWPRERYQVIPPQVEDSVDTVSGAAQQFTDGASSGGGSNIWFILGAIAAALVALGICILMVRKSRMRMASAL